MRLPKMPHPQQSAHDTSPLCATVQSTSATDSPPSRQYHDSFLFMLSLLYTRLAIERLMLPILLYGKDELARKASSMPTPSSKAYTCQCECVWNATPKHLLIDGSIRSLTFCRRQSQRWIYKLWFDATAIQSPSSLLRPIFIARIRTYGRSQSQIQNLG